MQEIQPESPLMDDMPIGTSPLDRTPELPHNGTIDGQPLATRHGQEVTDADFSAAAHRLVDTPASAAELVEETVKPSEGEASPENSPDDLQLEAGEKLRLGPKIEIILMRHGEPFRPGEIPDNPEEVARLGRLTDKGVEQARSAAEQQALEALDDGKPTTFFFLGSPTPYYIDGKPFAARSMETAQVARRAVETAIAEKGLTPAQADIHDFGAEIDGARPAKRLTEPDFYHVYGSDNPDAYANAVRKLAKEEGSIEKYGGPGHLEPWLRSDPSLEELREDVGAQSAPEVASRVMKFMGTLERYAALYANVHPDRKLVFFLASHGEIMRTVIQHGFGAEANAQGKVYDMAEVMPITVENYKATTQFNGNTYEVSI